MYRSLAFLIAAGGLLALSTLLAKVAGTVGLPALSFLTWSLVIGSALLAVVAATRNALPSINRRTVEYFFVTAFVTVAGSNLIFFSAAPVVGAGFVSLVITLPPLLTYAGALAFRLEAFSIIRFAGVCAALAGAAVLAINKVAAPDGSVFWVVLALCGPVLLTVGNLYRTLRWPEGEDPLGLALGMLVAAVIMLLVASFAPALILVPGPGFTMDQIALIGAQGIIFAAQFLLLFLLQASGGPVFLSLLGTVGAIFGVPLAVLLLDEQIPGGLLIGGSLIVLGVVLVNMQQHMRQEPDGQKD